MTSSADSRRVTVREVGGYEHPLPVIDVRVHRWPADQPVTDLIDDIKRRALVDEETAKRLLDTVFEIWKEVFWENFAPSRAKDFLGDSAEVFGAGRSGGRLVVDGLGRVDDWTEDQWGRWEQFCGAIHGWIRFHSEKLISKVMNTVHVNSLLETQAGPPGSVTRKLIRDTLDALDRLAAGEAFNEVIEDTGITSRLTSYLQDTRDPYRVQVAVVQHKYGSDAFVASTEDLLYEKIAGFAVEFADETERAEEIRSLAEQGRFEDAVALYFDEKEGREFLDVIHSPVPVN